MVGVTAVLLVVEAFEVLLVFWVAPFGELVWFFFFHLASEIKKKKKKRRQTKGSRGSTTMEVDPEFLVAVVTHARVFISVETIESTRNDGVQFVVGDFLHDKLRVTQQDRNVRSRAHASRQFGGSISDQRQQ